MERKTLGLDLRATATGQIEGYGSVFGNVDSYGDVVHRGAFTASLATWRQRGRLPPMLLQHGGAFGAAADMVPVGVWDEMREDARGLYVRGRVVALDSDLGKRVLAALQAKALDGLSIGFNIRKSSTRTDGGRDLLAVDLWEVSLVTFPANADARVTAVKSRRAVRTSLPSSPTPITRRLDTAVGAMRNRYAADRITATLSELHRLSTRAAIRGRCGHGTTFTL